MTRADATTELRDQFDLAVVGAGPAGLVAAITAASAGCTVALVDSSDRAGGQYYRHGPRDLETGADVRLHRHWPRFTRLLAELDAHCSRGTVHYLPQHAVFAVEATPVAGDDGGFRVHAMVGDRERTRRSIGARSLLLATGAADRQLPFPGWTTPGVMTAGGVQALLKGSHIAAGKHVVVAGTGPFLLAVADSLLTAGVEVVAVVEASDPKRYLRDPAGLIAAGSKAAEAATYAGRLARHRVPYLTRRAVVAAHGEHRIDSVTVARIDDDWRVRAGTQQQLSCDLLAVGYGFAPRVDLALALDCEVEVSNDGGLAVQVDDGQQTSVPLVFAVGELTGIGGVDLALTEGEIAGAAVADRLGRADMGRTPRQLAQLQQRRKKLRRFAATLATVHEVRGGWVDWSDDTTLVCRCEEISLGRIREAATQLGAHDARGVKLLARPGMGWCQGQICGQSTAVITATLQGREVTREDVVGMARRPLAQPVPLDLLATFAPPEDLTGG
jgi:NADPH-dependent 2,4-dienoyl-CoA reductase/sulfur reductase-like enzyme